jgi:hypothetical protein
MEIIAANIAGATTKYRFSPSASSGFVGKVAGLPR